MGEGKVRDAYMAAPCHVSSSGRVPCSSSHASSALPPCSS